MFWFWFFLLYLFVLNRFPSPFFLCPSTCKHREDIGKTCTEHPSLAGLRRDLWIIHGQKNRSAEGAGLAAPRGSVGLSLLRKLSPELAASPSLSEAASFVN